MPLPNLRRRKGVRRWASFLVATAILAGLLHPASARAQQSFVILAITVDQRLISFNSRAPDTANSIGQVSGLAGDGEEVVGIDFRPFDNLLYAVTDASAIYTVSTMTAEASFVCTFSPPLNGRFFGVDFNPAADRLRIVSERRQNLRVNVMPTVGTTTCPVTTDAALAYDAADVNKGKTPGIVGAAYINNDNSLATNTHLYVVDHRLDSLVRQDPPNAGTLKTVGRFGPATDQLVGFDVYSRRDATGAAFDNGAFASFTTRTTASTPSPDVQATFTTPSTLYTVDLFTGLTRNHGTIGGPTGRAVIDIAVPPMQ